VQGKEKEKERVRREGGERRGEGEREREREREREIFPHRALRSFRGSAIASRWPGTIISE